MLYLEKNGEVGEGNILGKENTLFAMEKKRREIF